MEKLDRTEQRIVGVLIEKQFSVPDTYPLTENALLAGCNQKSNRDPVMDLEPFMLSGALMALHEKEIVARVEGGGRVAKYRQKVGELLDIGDNELAVLAELLIRGPQAPGALKPRVARMGFHAGSAEIEDLLRHMAAKLPALVAQLPRRSRERDHRWQHLLGNADADVAPPTDADSEPVDDGPVPVAVQVRATSPDVMQRLAELEQRVALLEARLNARGE